jgi:hypothetical protein
MRAAAKKLFYEHLVSCSSDKFTVPIKQRYTDRIIKEAGFESETEGQFEATARNVIGTPANLIHEYLFSSRDGAERARDTQSAQVLSQMGGQLLQIDGMMQMLGQDRIFEILNETFRLAGAHDLKMQTDEADQQQELGSMQNEQFMQQLKQQWPQVLQAVEKLIGMAQGGGQPQPGQPQPGQPPREAPPQPDQQPQTSPDQQVML